MNNPIFILALSCDRGNLVGAQAPFSLRFLRQIYRPLLPGIIDGDTLKRMYKPISSTILEDHFDLLTFQVILKREFLNISFEIFCVRLINLKNSIDILYPQVFFRSLIYSGNIVVGQSG